MWFDRDEDRAPGAGEWPLPGVRVQLVSAAPVAFLRVASAVSAATTVTREAVTGEKGAYRFTGVPAGTYRVTASAVRAGFAYTSDTDGDLDWSVAVQVPANGTAEADFAGLGKGTLGGAVFLTTATRTPVTGAVVTCRWAGLDDVMGSADDVAMDVVAGTDGRYSLPQVPYGEFSCSGVDPVTGAVSAAARAVVASVEPVQAPLPIAPERVVAGTPDAVVPAPGPRAQVRGSALPRTGGQSADLLAGGLAFLLLGLVVQRLGRRRVVGG